MGYARGLGVLGMLAALTACAVGPNYRPPRPDVPAQFAAAAQAPAGEAASVDLASWWRALNDAELDSLVERAIHSNLDLKIALARLQQARTFEAVVVGHALPEVDASAAEGRGTGSDLSRGRAEQSLRSADNSTGLQHLNTVAGFDAVWEIDVFGRYRRALQAARFDAEAAAAARYDVLTSIVADVVRAYVDLRGYQVQLGVLHRASEVLRESLRLVNIRYERGITNELDVALATRELNTLDAEIPPVEAQVSAAEYALAVLLGEYPENIIEELKKPDLIPSMPAPAAPGSPIDLLKRRPDIRQAERELAAATARIGVATADLFPQIALVGSIGSQQGQLAGSSRVAGKHIWSFGPGALWPLLDFGAIDAQVDIADLEARASLENYRKTILAAVEEVDNALDEYSAQQARLRDLGLALLAGQRAVELATERYNRGLSDFLNVVDAERQYYDIQSQYVSAQIAQGEQFVRLYKSLGGGWQNYQNVPGIRQPQPAIIAAFRRAIERSTP
ncbi:MAG TPA: efflux transporter outer membrane subunit [Steroidobacteraceae bacterium]|nr:efflux transporter outer membrane subunit [Steroidobacteraceae bacterium]